MSENYKLSSTVLNLRTRIVNASPNNEGRVALLRFLTYGVFLFASFVSVVATAIFLAGLAWDANITVPTAIKAGVGTVASALGSLIHIGTDPQQSSESADFLFSFALRPTLLTAAFIWICIRVAKKWTSKFAPEDLATGWIAATMGLGVSSASYIALHFSKGSLSTWNGEVLGSVFGSTLQDFLTVFALVALPTAWAIRPRTESDVDVTSTGWMWSRQTLSIFGKLFLSLATVAVLTYGLINVIRPHFVLSSPDAAPLIDVSWQAVVAPLISLVLVLPTLVIYALMYFAGITIGFDAKSTIGGFDLADNIWAFTMNQADAFADRSVFVDHQSTLGIALVLLSIISALTAGAWASLKLNYKPTWSQDSRRFLLTAALVGLALLWITEARVSWTNGGVSPQEVTNGQLALTDGSIRYGLGAGSILGLAVTLSVLSVLSGGYLGRFLGLALPRTSRIVTSKADIVSGRTESTPLIRSLGRLISACAILWVAIPLSAAIGERIWAQVDGPHVVAKQAIAALESGDPAKIAKISELPASKTLWLPSPIMKRALRDWKEGASDAAPVVSDSNYALKNSNKRAWALGELDVVARTEWTNGNLRAIKNLPLEGEVQDRFKVLRHASYKWNAKSQYLTLETGPFFPKKLVGQIRVNGEKLKLGTYLAVPGVYRVTAPGIGIIAKTKENLVASDSNLIITVGVKASLPKKVEARITSLAQRTIASCSKIKSRTTTYDITTPCLPDNTIGQKAVASKSYDDRWDTFTVSKVKNVSLSCDDPTATVTSSKSMVNSRLCEQKASFTVKFVTNAVTEPIYETRRQRVFVEDGREDTCPDLPYYCWEPVGHYEYQDVQIVVGRKEISPRRVQLVPFTSDVSFRIEIEARKTKSGFTVKKQ